MHTLYLRLARWAQRWWRMLALAVAILLLTLFWLGREGDPTQNNWYIIALDVFCMAAFTYALVVYLLTPARITVERYAGQATPWGFSAYVDGGSVITNIAQARNVGRDSWLGKVRVEVALVDVTAPNLDLAPVVCVLGAGLDAAPNFGGHALQRGRQWLGKTRVTYGDRLHLLRTVYEDSANPLIGVMAWVAHPPRWALNLGGGTLALLQQTQTIADETPHRQVGAWTQGVRRLREGESWLHRAHIASARRGADLARQWDRPLRPRRQLIVVGDLGVWLPHDIAELVISLAVSLANAALLNPRVGVPTGLLILGPTPVIFAPALGEQARRAILHASVDFQPTPTPDTPATPVQTALRRPRPETTLVLVTTRSPEECEADIRTAQRTPGVVVCVIHISAAPQTWPMLTPDAVLTIDPELATPRRRTELEAALARVPLPSDSTSQTDQPAA